MGIPGKATAVSTQQFFQQHHNISSTTIAELNWQISQAGFGSYRVTLGQKQHEQALRHALQSGINLIDSSSNYGDGGSERLVGRVLVELIDAGEIKPRTGGNCLQSGAICKGLTIPWLSSASGEGRARFPKPRENMLKASTIASTQTFWKTSSPAAWSGSIWKTLDVLPAAQPGILPKLGTTPPAAAG